MTPAVDWLRVLAPQVPELAGSDWAWLDRLERELVDQLAAEPADPAARSAWLLSVRRRLARLPNGPARGPVPRALRQALAQAVCGFHDLDLRDATGPGHGALILAGCDMRLRRRWTTPSGCRRPGRHRRHRAARRQPDHRDHHPGHPAPGPVA